MFGTTSQHPGVTRLLVISSAVAAGLLLTSCSSTAPTASSSSAATAASSTTPDLKGKTIRIAVGAAPDVSDAKIALMKDTLTGWGADVSIVNQSGDPAAIRAILSNNADIGANAVSSAINSGLLAFGPAQPRLDYHFIGAPNVKKVSDMVGKTYGTSNQHGVEALAFASLMKAKGIPQDKVTTTIAGSAGVRVAAMLAGHIQGTFVHAQDVKALTDQGFNDLATMSEISPDLADSFLVTTKQWYQQNPAVAKAVDQAWIEAAKVFNDDEAKWTQAAIAYGGGKEEDAKALYDAMKASDTFPVAASAFSAKSAQGQEDQASAVRAITSSPALKDWFSETAWDAAVKAEGLNK